MTYLWPLALLLVVSCAAQTPQVAPTPMPDDIQPWFSPTVDPGPVLSRAVAERSASPAEKVVPYVPGTVTLITVTPTAPLVVQLQEGEVNPDVIWPPVPLLAEDQAQGQGVTPWEIRTSTAHPQVYITVKQPGLSLGVTITTRERTYLLDLKSVAKSPMRLLRWTYADADAPRVTSARRLPDPRQPQQYHVGYRIEPQAPVPTWCPFQVVDSGGHTFIFFPRNLPAMDVPMIRLIGPSGPELVNAHMEGQHVLVIDHLAARGFELRIGSGDQAEVVRILRGTPQTISCPGDPACPVWPDALARR